MSRATDEGFLGRWSRRKRESAGGLPPADPAPDAPETAASGAAPPLPAGTAPAAADDPAEIAAYLDELPKLDDFTPATDLKPFLHRFVPEALKLAAMRRMWALDPAIRDFVNDAREYAYDWNVPDGAPGYGPLETTDEMRAWVMRQFERTPTDSREASKEAPDAAAEGAGPAPGEAVADASGAFDASQQDALGAPMPDAAEEAAETVGEARKAVLAGAFPADSGAPESVAVQQDRPDSARATRTRERHGGALPR